MDTVFIYITARDRKQARTIGRALVTERLAACVNIIDGMNSLYFWENRLCDDNETVLIAKTRDSLVDALVRRVKALHTYSVPCIVALPIIGGNRDFIAWIKKETSRRRRPRKRHLSKKSL